MGGVMSLSGVQFTNCAPVATLNGTTPVPLKLLLLKDAATGLLLL